MFLTLFFCTFLPQNMPFRSHVAFKTASPDGSRTWRKNSGRLPPKKQICPRSTTKPGREKIPTFCSAAPGGCLPATVAPLPACPRTAALRLALCSSLSRVSPFTFVLPVLTCLHSVAIFSLHTIQYRHCVSQKNSLNHIFFCLSHHGTVSRAKFPSFLSLMMMGSSSSLPLFNIVPHTAPPAPPKSKRDWKNDSTALLMDLFEEKFLANSMKSLTQQQWREILLKIEDAFPLTPPRT